MIERHREKVEKDGEGMTERPREKIERGVRE